MTVRVLVVDDTRVIRNSIKDFFDKGFFTIAGEAADGLQAQKEYSRLRPDIVTMDMNMPNCDGVEAIRMILEEDPNAYIVIISSMDDDIIRGLEAGARACIFKPISMIKFRELMAKVVYDMGNRDAVTGKFLTNAPSERIMYENGIRKNYSIQGWNKSPIYRFEIEEDRMIINLIGEPQEKTFNKLIERIKILKGQGTELELRYEDHLRNNVKVHFIEMLI